MNYEISRIERRRACHCNQNGNRIRCGHRPVTDVWWEVDERTYWRLKDAKAYLARKEELNGGTRHE